MHLSGALDSPNLAHHWNGAKDALIFLPGQVGLNDPTSFCSHQWCVHCPGGSDNKGSNCASWDF